MLQRMARLFFGGAPTPPKYAARLARRKARVPGTRVAEQHAASTNTQRNRRNSASDAMKPKAGQPPDASDRSNARRARAVSPRTMNQFPSP